MNNGSVAGTQGELHLRVFGDRSELFPPDGDPEVFTEGSPSDDARRRYERIQRAFDDGYLDSVIDHVRSGAELRGIDDEARGLIDDLVAGVTSEAGRALVALSLLMMCVKDIEPQQSIRLHKSGRGQFSWREGISMRSLDSRFVTPTLRSNDLLSLNTYGFMMTRSLAENYPYSLVYKAALRGPRRQWLGIVEALENGHLEARAGLELLLAKLMQRTKMFRDRADNVLELTEAFLSEPPAFEDVLALIRAHLSVSAHSARLLEVAMHSLMQCLEDEGVIEGELRPLAQMRSANKKAGNVGDVEIIADQVSEAILEAWDAKFGQPYLRDQVDELAEKLPGHATLEVAGFVVDVEPLIPDDVEERVLEVSEEFGVTVEILSLENWAGVQVDRSGHDRAALAVEWFRAYAESLCLRRLDRAPIDEPADKWIEDLERLLESR